LRHRICTPRRVAALALAFCGSARAEEIDVCNFGVSAHGDQGLQGRKIGYTNPRFDQPGPWRPAPRHPTGLKPGRSELVPTAASAKAVARYRLVDVAPLPKAAAVAVSGEIPHLAKASELFAPLATWWA